MQLKSLLLFVGLLSAPVVAGKIYTWTDANGTVHYSATPKIDANAKQFDVSTTNVIKADPIDIKTAAHTSPDTDYSSQDAANMMSSDMCRGAKRKLKFSSQMIASGNYEWKGNKFNKEHIKAMQKNAKKQVEAFC